MNSSVRKFLAGWLTLVLAAAPLFIVYGEETISKIALVFYLTCAAMLIFQTRKEAL